MATTHLKTLLAVKFALFNIIFILAVPVCFAESDAASLSKSNRPIFDISNPDMECLAIDLRLGLGLINEGPRHDDERETYRVWVNKEQSKCIESAEDLKNTLNKFGTGKNNFHRCVEGSRDEVDRDSQKFVSVAGYFCFSPYSIWTGGPAAPADQRIVYEKIKKYAKDAKENTRKRMLAKMQSTSVRDTVAKVLNYSEGCGDDGCVDSFWYQVDRAVCMYERATFDSDKGKIVIGRSIKLSDLDPASIKFQQRTVMISGRQVTMNYVMYEGRALFGSPRTDLDRLVRGWSLVYSDFCRGLKRDF